MKKNRRKNNDLLIPSKRLELLNLTKGWTYQEVKLYFGVGNSKSYDILALAEPVKYFSGHYTINSILALFGLTKEQEIQCALMQLGYYDKVDSFHQQNIKEATNENY